MDSITKTPEHPLGPEVGPDGIVNKNVSAALEAYSQSLAGKQVLDWEGLLTDFNEIDERGKAPAYNLSIAMGEENATSDASANVYINEISKEQMKSLRLGSNLDSGGAPFGSCEVGCQRVKFSGTILGVQSDGAVTVEVTTIEPLD